MTEQTLKNYLKDCNISFEDFKKFLIDEGSTFTKLEDGQFYYYHDDIFIFLQSEIVKLKKIQAVNNNMIMAIEIDKKLTYESGFSEGYKKCAEEFKILIQKGIDNINK